MNRKRLLSVVLCLLMVFSILPGAAYAESGVAINDTNFPDEVFRSYVSEHFDSNGDGSLSDAEIAMAYTINVIGSNVKALKGLEYFTSLIDLYCWENDLTELDVSKNVDLTVLDCSSNHIESLDVSKNTELYSLSCYGNTLKELDVSNNTSLVNLDCSINQLTNLDLSKNTELAFLNCDNNQLKDLDLSKNSELSILFCQSNQLSDLDVSKNLSLSCLFCRLNNLSNLNLHKNTNLQELDCSINKIDQLDISACPKLLRGYINGEMGGPYYDDTIDYLLPNYDLNLYLCIDATTKIIPDVRRIAGTNRFKTAFEAADRLKAEMGVDEFPSIVIASGMDFPDALAGAYLAVAKDAPVLLTHTSVMDDVAKYVKDNMASGGTVYILGGSVAVPDSMEAALTAQGITNVKRLKGSNRYDTNIEILKEAGVDGKDILVCSGNGYADSLSASATGKPILLVGNVLTPAQNEYLESVKGSVSGNFYAIGGTVAVPDGVFYQIQDHAAGTTERVAGDNRFMTSKAIAQKFFPADIDTVVLAYAMNYPDGLAGGPVAYKCGAPLLLINNNNYAAAKDHVKATSVSKVLVMGGETLISDEVAIAMLK